MGQTDINYRRSVTTMFLNDGLHACTDLRGPLTADRCLANIITQDAVSARWRVDHLCMLLAMQAGRPGNYSVHPLTGAERVGEEG